MTGARTQSPLALHVVYDETATEGRGPIEQLATALYSQLSSGDRAPRVPVRLWRSQLLKNGERRLPSHIPLDWAARNVVIVVVDQIFFEHRSEWNNCINALAASANANRDLILPLAVQADAARVTAAFGDVNHIAVRNPRDLDKGDRVLQAVYTAMLRLLVPALPRVFLCHAKADGAHIAKSVRRYLNEETQLSSFFDMHDVPHGHRVKESIEGSIRDSILLVIWTDRLLDSPWCQMEIIEARRQQRPLLVLDALVNTTPRLFPFLGNMPVVRWRRDPSPVVSAILLELIRTYHLEAIFESRRERESDVPSFCLHPPDLLDSSLERTTATTSHEPWLASEGLPDLWVYPDPPLKSAELEVLRELVPRKRFLVSSSGVPCEQLTRLMPIGTMQSACVRILYEDCAWGSPFPRPTRGSTWG